MNHIFKYVKLPVEIEACEFTGDNFEEVKKFTNGLAKDFTAERKPDGSCWCIIPTLEGDHKAMKGDFIIKGIHGEFYPCKPDIFNKTYMPVPLGGEVELITKAL